MKNIFYEINVSSELISIALSNFDTFKLYDFENFLIGYTSILLLYTQILND